MSWSWRLLLLVLCARAELVWAQPADCAPDEALSLAAADLLLEGRERPSAPQLVAAVRGVGSDAVGLHALFLAAGAADAKAKSEAWLSERRKRADAELVCGNAQSERGKLLIASARAGRLAPIDEHARVVRGQLAAGFGNAELVVASADGQLVRVGVSAQALERGVPLATELRAPLDVQLVASGPAGPRPVAERHVAVRGEPAKNVGSGAAPACGIAEASAGIGDPAGEAERGDLAPLILDLRRVQGRPRLRDNRLLRQAAADHAAQVCREGRVAHELDRGHGPPERLAAAGLSARLLGEAIARAPNASAAFEALRHSPSHLLTLLDQRFTDMGIGTATDDVGKHCYVVVLCAWPRYVGR